MNVLLDRRAATLGYCTGGVAEGVYVGLFPLAYRDDRDQEVAVWEAWFSVPLVEEGLFHADAMSIDPKDRRTIDFLESLSIVRVPEPAASRGLSMLFPEQAAIAAVGRAGVRSGRFSRGEALLNALQCIVGDDGIDPMTESLVPTGVGELLASLQKHRGLVDDVGAILAGVGLSLAVVPARSALPGGGEPWQEFLS